jgi:hypothetical protein
LTVIVSRRPATRLPFATGDWWLKSRSGGEGDEALVTRRLVGVVLTVLEFLPSSHGSFFTVVCGVQLLPSVLVSGSKLAASMPVVIVFGSTQM